MGFVRSELRAFPRLMVAKPATLLVEDLWVEGQVLDISLGGCKALPSRLEELVSSGFRPGARLMIELLGHRFPGHLAWATPNYSALGCAFDEVLPQSLLELITGPALGVSQVAP